MLFAAIYAKHKGIPVEDVVSGWANIPFVLACANSTLTSGNYYCGGGQEEEEVPEEEEVDLPPDYYYYPSARSDRRRRSSGSNPSRSFRSTRQ